MKKDKYTNKTGYDEAYLTKLNPYNIIPSNNITMENVNRDILGLGMNESGEINSMKYMEPNEKYFFKNADSVMEMPIYAKHGVELPKYQTGVGMYGQNLLNYNLDTEPYNLDGFNLNGVTASNNPNMFSQDNFTNNVGNQNMYDDMGEIDYSVNPDTKLPLHKNNETNTIMLSEDDINNAESGYSDDSYNQPTKQQLVYNNNYYRNTKGIDYGTEDHYREVGRDPNNQQGNTQNGLFNPYQGFDINNALHMLGRGIENKNGWQIGVGGLKAGLAGARNVLSGVGAARARNYAYDQREETLNNNYTTQPRVLKKGGEKMSEYKEGTGAYTTGLAYYDPNMEKMANAEIERGEYKKDAETQQIQEVLGKTHEEGGEKVHLKEGDQILTDHTKLGGTLAKKIREDYDLNKIKAKHTYADVLDKFKVKSGLKKALKEKEDLLKKLEKEEGTSNENSQNINTKFLVGKLQELDTNISTLEVAQKELYDFLFQKQEKAKPKEERTEEGLMYAQDGGEMRKIYDFYKTTQKDIGSYEDFEKSYKKGEIYIPKRIYNSIVGGENSKKIEYIDNSLRGDIENIDYFDSGISNAYLRNELLNGRSIQDLDLSTPGDYQKASDLYKESYKKRTGRDFYIPTESNNTYDIVPVSSEVKGTDNRLDNVGNNTSIRINPTITDSGGRPSSLYGVSAPILNQSFDARKKGKLNINSFLQMTDEEQSAVAKEYGIPKEDLIEKSKDVIARDFIFNSDVVPEKKVSNTPTTETIEEVVEEVVKEKTTTQTTPPKEEKESIFKGLEDRDKINWTGNRLDTSITPRFFIDDIRLPRLNTLDYRDVEAVQQDLAPYLQIASEQRRIAERQTEGLAPEQRAAVLANTEANIQEGLNKSGLQIDASNLQNLQQTRNANANTDAQEQQGNIRLEGTYDELANRSLDTHLANISNFQETVRGDLDLHRKLENDKSLYLAANPDIRYDDRRGFGHVNPWIGYKEQVAFEKYKKDNGYS